MKLITLIDNQAGRTNKLEDSKSLLMDDFLCSKALINDSINRT